MPEEEVVVVAEVQDQVAVVQDPEAPQQLDLQQAGAQDPVIIMAATVVLD